MDMKNPIQRLISSNINIMIDPYFNTYKKSNIFLSELDVELEKAFLDQFFISKNLMKNYTFNQEIRDQSIFIPNSQANSKIVDIIIQKSHSNIEYNLNSGSFLEVMAYIGGLWSMAFLIFSMIVKSYNKNEFFSI